MLHKIHFLVILIAGMLAGCVQKAYQKTVVFELNVKDVRNIKTVGIRGNSKPLSWEYSLEMKAIKKDTFYTCTATFITGYKFVEAKFTVNDDFELKEKANRKIYFSDKDTTYYNAIFDVNP